jgi:predicted transcriptional regulator
MLRPGPARIPAQAKGKERPTMRIIEVAAVLFVAIGARAQGPTSAQIDRAVTAQHTFFDDQSNRTLSRCSNEAWALMRYEGELALSKKKGSETTAQEVMDKQTSLDECKSQAAAGYDDILTSIASMLKMQEQGGNFVHEIREQLKYLETLNYIQALAEGASEKILRDYLYDSHDELQARYEKLVGRYNALAEGLATVPLPSNYERPRRLHCETTSNHLGEWSTITTNCQ